jgi:hypothetical protein
MISVGMSRGAALLAWHSVRTRNSIKPNSCATSGYLPNLFACPDQSGGVISQIGKAGGIERRYHIIYDLA